MRSLSTLINSKDNLTDFQEAPRDIAIFYLCPMTKHLKIGMICMAGAVLLMPLALFLKNSYTAACIAVIIASMLLEVIGLIFVIISLIKKRKS